MKRGLWLVTRPGTFFNQLQFSSHHLWILMSFAAMAFLETHWGAHLSSHQGAISWLSQTLSVSSTVSFFLLSTLRFAVLLLSAFALATVIWFVGNLFGKRTSKRVLFRRLAVVFTVYLAAYALQHVVSTYPWAMATSCSLFAWGSLLGYFAVREQFALSHAEAFVISLFAVFLGLSSWHIANQSFDNALRKEGSYLSRSK